MYGIRGEPGVWSRESVETQNIASLCVQTQCNASVHLEFFIKMSEEKKYRIYSAADIEKYHRGLLSPKEMHEMEKAALDDPFLADALEGYGAVNVNAAADIEELEKKLEQRVSGGKVIRMA